MQRVHRIWMMAIGWVAVKIFLMSGVHAGAGSSWTLEHCYYCIIIVLLYFLEACTFAPALAKKLVLEH